MPLDKLPERSLAMTAGNKRTGVTILEMETLLVQARRMGAPDHARIGADLKLSFDSPGILLKASAIWTDEVDGSPSTGT